MSFYTVRPDVGLTYRGGVGKGGGEEGIVGKGWLVRRSVAGHAPGWRPVDLRGPCWVARLRDI